MQKNWKKLKVKDLVSVNYGKSPKGILSDEGFIPVIGTGGVERFGRNYIYDGESIVLGRKGTIDNPVYINGKFWAIDTTYFLTNFKDVDVKWLYYFFNTIDFRSMNEATGVPSLSRDYLYSIDVTTPSKNEQTVIAEVLNRIDSAIEQTQKLIEKQKRIKQGLMQDLLTKGIDESGNIRNEKTHRFKDSRLGRIPEEWEVKSWKECSEKIQDGTHFSPKTSTTGEFKYITSKNVKFGWLDLSNCEYIDGTQHQQIYRRCSVKEGDVLLTKDGANTGNASLNPLKEPFSLLSSVSLIRCINSVLLNEFLLQFILSEKGQRIIKDSMSGLAITRITLEIINSFLIIVPSVKEQGLIVEILAIKDAELQSERKKLIKLQAIKKGLMQDLLTGKKSVSELISE